MLILVAGPNGGAWKSTCTVNLACELAGLDSHSTDRWQGERSVVMVDAEVEGAANRCCSGENLPVSSERLSLEDSRDMEKWIHRMRTVMAEVDYVVVEGPSDNEAVTKAIVDISDLVVIPCSFSAADLVIIARMMELIKSARSARPDNGPKCLLVPMHADGGTAAERETALELELEKFEEPVGPVFHHWAEFAEAFNACRWIGDFSPKSAASGEVKKLTAIVEHMLRESAPERVV